MAKQISIAAVVAVCIFTDDTSAATVWAGRVRQHSGHSDRSQAATLRTPKVTVTNSAKHVRHDDHERKRKLFVTHLIPDVYTIRVEAAG